MSRPTVTMRMIAVSAAVIVLTASSLTVSAADAEPRPDDASAAQSSVLPPGDQDDQDEAGEQLHSLAEPPAASALDLQAALPQSERFVITSPKHTTYFNKKLADSDAWAQAMAFDYQTQHAYISQSTKKMSNLGSTVGDMAISQLDERGNYVNGMALRGFGHGVGVGVERVGSDVYIWLEAKAATIDGPIEGSHTGYGTQLARVKYRAANWASPVTASSAGVQIFKPIPDVVATGKDTRRTTYFVPMTDGDQLTIRYSIESLDADGKRNKNSTMRLASFSLSALRNANFKFPKPSRDMPVPTPIHGGTPPVGPYQFHEKANASTSQQWATAGSYLYLLSGGCTSVPIVPTPARDKAQYRCTDTDRNRKFSSSMWSFNLNEGNGKQVQRAWITSYPDLPHREPEGLAPLRYGGNSYLVFSIAHRLNSDPKSERRVTLLYIRDHVTD